MIAGNSFNSFHEMYQGAVKIARVLDETNLENNAINLGKGKFEHDNRESKGENPRRFNSGGPQDKGKQPIPW